VYTAKHFSFSSAAMLHLQNKSLAASSHLISISRSIDVWHPTLHCTALVWRAKLLFGVTE
jgi:hypothetical protein